MRRVAEIDILRGIAVFLMVAAHMIAFYGPVSFYNVRVFGDIFCFVLFLFTFGFGLFFSTIRKQSVNKIFKKTLYLILSYYFLLVISLLSEPKSIEHFLRSILFLYVPILSEFLIPFIIYAFSSIFFIKFSDLIFKKSIAITFLNLFFIGFLLYFLGIYLFRFISLIDLPKEIRTWLTLLSGSKNYGLFPVLQYSIVVLLGIFYGYILDKKIKIHKFLFDKLLNSLYVKVILFLVIIFILLQFLLNIQFIIQQRFPVTLVFMLIGLIFILLLLMIIKVFNLTRVLYIFSIFGKHSLGIYIFHVAVIKLLWFKTIILIDSSFKRFAFFLFLLFGYFIVFQLKNLIKERVVLMILDKK